MYSLPCACRVDAYGEISGTLACWQTGMIGIRLLEHVTPTSAWTASCSMSFLTLRMLVSGSSASSEQAAAQVQVEVPARTLIVTEDLEDALLEQQQADPDLLRLGCVTPAKLGCEVAAGTRDSGGGRHRARQSKKAPPVLQVHPTPSRHRRGGGPTRMQEARRLSHRVTWYALRGFVRRAATAVPPPVHWDHRQ